MQKNDIERQAERNQQLEEILTALKEEIDRGTISIQGHRAGFGAGNSFLSFKFNPARATEKTADLFKKIEKMDIETFGMSFERDGAGYKPVRVGKDEITFSGYASHVSDVMKKLVEAGVLNEPTHSKFGDLGVPEASYKSPSVAKTATPSTRVSGAKISQAITPSRTPGGTLSI